MCGGTRRNASARCHERDHRQEDAASARLPCRTRSRPAARAPRTGGDPESRSLGDSIGADDPNYELVELGEAIGPAFRELPSREQAIVQLRFFEDLTQAEIAERVGISQMHVSRLLRRALDTLHGAVAA